MKRTLLLAAALGLPALALAQAPAQPDPAKARDIVNQVCAACHGADGSSLAPAPRARPTAPRDPDDSGQWAPGP